MSRFLARLDAQFLPTQNSVLLPIFLAANVVCNVVCGISFRLSAASPNWRGFLAWQVVGNLAGLVTVLTLTGMLRFVPLRVAYPLTTGLAVISVQVLAARWFFHEPVSPAQWGGTLLVAGGILLIGMR